MASVQRRARYEVEQEYIVNGLLVTINKREKIYFERVEDFQAFTKSGSKMRIRLLKNVSARR